MCRRGIWSLSERCRPRIYLETNVHLRRIGSVPYQIPFEDETFDVVVSDQVFEHVRNYDETLAELSRVMKPGSIGLHRFPSRLRPLESHVKVPFSSVFRNRVWMRFWIRCGFRKPGQAGEVPHVVADRNLDYLNNSTNYLRGREIMEAFGKYFSKAGYADRCWFSNSPNRRGRVLGAAARWIPVIPWIYRTFWTRVVFHVK